VTDHVGSLVSKKFKIKVLKGMSISTKGLIKGKVGKNYSATLRVTGGKNPFGWSLVSGRLPGGLSFDSLTGKITGTPTTAGDFDFTVAVADSLGGSAFKDLTLVIKPLPHATWGLCPAIYYSVNDLWVGQTAVGDLNGDGRMDVAVAARGYGEGPCGRNALLVYYQDTFGGLSGQEVIDGLDICLRRIAVGDLNGDGKDDLAVSGISRYPH